MYVEDAISKFINRSSVIDELPDQVRGIKIQPKIFVRDDFKHPAPHRWGNRQIVAARPFVVREDHGTIFNGDLYAVVGSKLDDRDPEVSEASKALLQTLILIP